MNLNELIDRAKKINEIVWESSNFTIEEDTIKMVNNELSIILPTDFVVLNKQIRYECSNFVQFFILDAPKDNGSSIVRGNLEIRKQYMKDSEGKSDMSHILVLADDDGGSVFMITQDSPEKPTPIIWCDYGDMYYYSIHKEFRNSHDEWPSFTAFFEYLVEQEEKKLME